MIWLYAFLFFLIFCIYFIFINYIYSQILIAINKKSLISDLKKIIVYMLMIPFFVAPLIAGSEINGYKELVSNDNYYFIFNVICFALSLLPGFLIFNEYYLKQARRNFRY